MAWSWQQRRCTADTTGGASDEGDASDSSASCSALLQQLGFARLAAASAIPWRRRLRCENSPSSSLWTQERSNQVTSFMRWKIPCGCAPQMRAALRSHRERASSCTSTCRYGGSGSLREAKVRCPTYEAAADRRELLAATSAWYAGRANRMVTGTRSMPLERVCHRSQCEEPTPPGPIWYCLEELVPVNSGWGTLRMVPVVSTVKK